MLAVAVLVTTIAGVPGVAGHADGAANVAQFDKPTHIAVDRANGDLYVTDRNNNSVRKLSGGGVSTFLLHTTKSPAALNFDGPMNGGIAIEPPGTYSQSPGYGRMLFISSSGAHQVAQIDVFGYPGVHDFEFVGVRDVPGGADFPFYQGLYPAFNTPTAIALDRWRYLIGQDRDIFVANTGDGSIRRLTRRINFEAEYYTRSVVTCARGFTAPRGLAVGPDGSLFVADTGSHTIRRVAPDGTVTTVAGVAGVAGSDDGPALASHLNTPTGIDVDDAGNVYISDTGNHTIRRLRTDGILDTIAGKPGVGGYTDGDGPVARFSGPVGLQVAADGSLIVADTSNHVIRKITIGPKRRAVRH